MVPEGITFALFARVACHKCKKVQIFMSKGAILKTKCKKVPIWYFLLTRSFLSPIDFFPIKNGIEKDFFFVKKSSFTFLQWKKVPLAFELIKIDKN